MRQRKHWLFQYNRKPRVWENNPPTNLEAILAVILVGGGVLLLMGYLIFK